MQIKQNYITYYLRPKMLFSLPIVWGWYMRIKQGRVHPITGQEDPEQRNSSNPSLNLALKRGG